MAPSRSPSQIHALIAALGGDDDIAREAAIARLAILGAPAADRLVAAWPRTTDRRTRSGILQALERRADPRLLTLAREALLTGGDLAVMAAGVLRALVDSSDQASDQATSLDALDILVGLVLDEAAERRVRVAAAEGLESVKGVDVRVFDTLRRLAGEGGGAERAAWRDTVEGRLPDEPSVLRAAVTAVAADAPLSELQQAVDRVRARERETAGTLRHAWEAVRGTLHQALALRGSRVALYDLRESLETAAEPLPPSFLAAVHAVGDESCLGPLAAAWEAAENPRWRSQLRDAFQAIVRRERLTRRGGALKRLAANRPNAFEALAGRAPAKKPQ